jgi:ATP-dependent helicase/nuclease subunit A
MFLASQPAHWFDATLGPEVRERVMVRGIVDGILERSDGIEIVDYKTDAVTHADIAARAQRYEAQMALYAAAVEPIFRKPVRHRWLVFLHARRIVPVEHALTAEA